MAACASASLPEPVGRVSGGLELPWRDVSGAELVNPIAAAKTIATHLRTPCSTGAFRKTGRASAAQAGGPVTANVAAGLPTATIALTGSGGAPDVDVAGPGGAALPAGSYVAKGARMSTTYVVLKPPAGGRVDVHAARRQPGDHGRGPVGRIRARAGDREPPP